MPILLFILFLPPLLFAYEPGDTMSDSLYERLGMQPSKTYAVGFFASWCGSCAMELPELNRLHRRLDRTRHEIIGIDIDENREKGAAFQRKIGIDFRVVNDSDHAIVSDFAPLGMPSLYIVKDKKIVQVLTGAVDDSDRIVEKYLKEADE